MMDLVLPRYRAEGKSYLKIAFGCTGGRHRSVYLVPRAASLLEDDDCRRTVDHRDLSRADPAGTESAPTNPG